MQNAPAMNADTKALLTLLLLKTGTSSKDIQTVLTVAAASRVMVAAECTLPWTEDSLENAIANNVSAIRTNRSHTASIPEFDPEADATLSDIKALLSLLLLQNGVSLKEIQTTLRLSATSQDSAGQESADQESWDDDGPELEEEDSVPQQPARQPREVSRFSAKQVLRNDHLAPISIRSYAA